jgi:hypothetical protein
MTESAAKKGGVFTRYGVVIIIGIVIVFGLLYLAGDFVYSEVRPAAPTITEPVDSTTVGANPPKFQGEMPLDVAIEIYIDDKKVATRTIQAQTIWTYTPDQQLEIGEHSIYVVAVSHEGLRSKKSSLVKFKVPRRPQIGSLQDGQTSVRQPQFSGDAGANAEVDLYVDDAFVNSTKADDKGKWSFEKLPSFAQGTHKAYIISVETIGEFDNKSEVMTFTIQ